MRRKTYLVLENVRSAHNVGSMLRTAEGLGVSEVVLCGITPYPTLSKQDDRLPYLSAKITRRIAKTSLGAELTQPWRYQQNAVDVLNQYRREGIELVSLEQDPQAIALNHYRPIADVALVVGNEIDGVSKQVRLICDHTVEIAMSGRKESFNVSAATAMALFYLTLML